jgi:hypothetical protein
MTGKRLEQTDGVENLAVLADAPEHRSSILIAERGKG